jgi:N4-gp56 family major capsid protein
MADFTTVMTDTVAVGDSIKQAYDQSFIIANGQSNVMEALCQQRYVQGAKTINMQKFPRLAAATTPLTEKEDPASVALSDSNIAFTPLEYGNVITTTNLAELHTGGQAGLAAVQSAGINASVTQNKLATVAAEAGTNILSVDGGDGSALAATDIVDGAFLNKMYNKLARASVPMFGGNTYVAIMHDDVIADLRASTGAGSWEDVSKYAAPGDVLMNEVGMFKGFRIIRNNDATVTTDGGATTVDLYKSTFLGAGGLGKATSQEVQSVIRPAYDKLGRMANVGWYGVFNYGIVDQDAVWVGLSASSLGVNA